MACSKEKILRMLLKDLVFTRHALEQMLLPSRRLTESEVEEAIRKGRIIESQKTPAGEKVIMQSYKPAVCVVLGVSDCLVVITAWRGTRK
jgi:hypothetical protein